MTANDLVFSSCSAAEFKNAFIESDPAIEIFRTENGVWEVWCCGLGQTFGSEESAFEWVMKLAAEIDAK